MGNQENNNEKAISVILADDHPLVRKAIRDLIEEESDIKIVAEAGTGEEVISYAEEMKPDVIIMDISMPKVNGLEATERIHKKHPEIKILVLTVHTDSEHILGILEAGAAGYLTKSIFGPEIVHAIRSVVYGESVLSEEIYHMVIRHAISYLPKVHSTNSGETLTSKEQTLLRYMALGMSNKDIASHMNLSTRTVKNYLAEIFLKLRVSSRTEAVIYALRHSIIHIEDL
jgi:two-component system, NarL family, response regulator LiaR